MIISNPGSHDVIRTKLQDQRSLKSAHTKQRGALIFISSERQAAAMPIAIME
jgi:hypothetical protein